MFRLSSFLLSLAAALVLPAAAQFDIAKELGAGKDESVARLVAENTAVAPGVPFTVAVKIDLPGGWHSYYLNSGGVEQHLELQWTLPDGWRAGPVQWPVPKVVDGYDAKSFAYTDEPVFLAEITPPASAKPGESAKIAVKAHWQICRTGACQDQSAELELNLPVATAAAIDPAQAALFQQARAALPKESAAWSASFQKAGDTLKLKLTPGSGAAETLDPATLEFIPTMAFSKNLTAGGSVAREGHDWILTLPTNKEDALGAPLTVGNELDGILVAKAPLDTATGAPAILIHALATSGGAANSAPAGLPIGNFLTLLGLMALGGLILNLMPCVFPVIGLKIMGFVQQAGEDPRKVVKHGLAFTFGVLLSFWVLSGILFAARAAALAKSGSAESIGWGYQLQNPWIVLSLLVLIFLLALNMFGVFEIGASATSVGGSLQSRQGISGAFFSGLLATVVATPCSAPFLGPAIGVAIGLPSMQFFSAFTAMAIGLAFPYLLLSIFPKLVNFLPRPGAWMESFKQAMSFLLFATAGYLLWVYVGQIALENMLGPVIGLSAIAIAAWIYGRWNLPHRSGKVRGVATVLALAFAIGGFWVSTPPKKSALVWEPWSAQRVEELTKQGKPVFVDFTALWCPTCQVNKKRAYTPEVIALMHEKGVVLLEGDKTNPNPAIEEKLRELKRTAIPVNVLYVPGREPVVTPELLSPDYMKTLIGGIKGS